MAELAETQGEVQPAMDAIDAMDALDALWSVGAMDAETLVEDDVVALRKAFDSLRGGWLSVGQRVD